jgi:glycerol kinase
MVGLTRGANAGHIARASLESIAYQTMDIIKSMQADSGIEIKELRVDGGAAANDLLMQFQSDLLRVPVIRPKTLETTALGAAYLAGLAVGYWENQEAVNKQWQKEQTFTPQMAADEVEQLRSGWDRALKAAISWSER